MTAKSLARMTSLFINDGEAPMTTKSSASRTRIFSEGFMEKVLLRNRDTRYDYALFNETTFTDAGMALRVCDNIKAMHLGWGGNGGQLSVIVPKYELSIAFITPFVDLVASPQLA